MKITSVFECHQELADKSQRFEEYVQSQLVAGIGVEINKIVDINRKVKSLFDNQNDDRVEFSAILHVYKQSEIKAIFDLLKVLEASQVSDCEIIENIKKILANQ